MNKNPEVGDYEGKGEEWLIAHSPSFKNRYALDSDFVIGCRIGCTFCYYRMIKATAPYIGTGKLKRLATPEKFNEFLENSKIFWPDKQLIIISARSDGSMQWQDTIQFLDKHFNYNNKVLLLQRAPIFQPEIEYMASDKRFHFGTTLTPLAFEKGWNKIKTDWQINQLEKSVALLGEKRIAVEVGPVNEMTIVVIEPIFKRLYEIGITRMIYRGISIGAFDMSLDSIKKRLEKVGFLDKQLKPETYYTPQGEEKHPFYGLKNYLTKAMEAKIRELGAQYNLKLYRHTGIFYFKEWGIPVSIMRRNRIRKDIAAIRPPLPINLKQVSRLLEYLGYTVTDIDRERRIIDTKETVTEDIAMRISAQLQTMVQFANYRVSPTMSDVKFYRQNNIFMI